MHLLQRLLVPLLLLVSGCTEPSSPQSTSVTEFADAVVEFTKARDFEIELLASTNGAGSVSDETYDQWLFLYMNAYEKAVRINPDERLKQIMGENVYQSLPLFIEGLRLKHEGIRDFDDQKIIQGATLINSFSEAMTSWQESENMKSDKILWEWRGGPAFQYSPTAFISDATADY